MIEIRIHGRGGQGAVTTSQILAIAAFYDGKESQAFPNFGVERTGAPVEAFCRIDTAKINLRSQVYQPDVVIVLDASLVQAIDVTKGLKQGGAIILNTNKRASELGLGLSGNVHVVDATSIATEIFGKPIVNTAVLGAFAAVTRVVSLDSLLRAIDDQFLQSKGQKVADLNKQAIQKVFEMTK